MADGRATSNSPLERVGDSSPQAMEMFLYGAMAAYLGDHSEGDLLRLVEVVLSDQQSGALDKVRDRMVFCAIQRPGHRGCRYELWPTPPTELGG